MELKGQAYAKLIGFLTLARLLITTTREYPTPSKAEAVLNAER